MRKNLMYLFGGAAFMVSGCLFAGCSDNGNEEDYNEYSEPINIELTRSESDAINSVNAFAFDLLKAYEARFSDEEPNFIMSPQSAAWCLAMLANGAPESSESFREIADVLHLGEDATLNDVNAYTQKLTEAITAKHGNADVRVANALFYKDYIGIRESYVALLKSFYSADVLKNPTNQIIDSWIDKKTGGQIKNFAHKNGLDQDSIGVINTLYFTGKWSSPFKKENTKEREFRNADGTKSMVMTMLNNQYCYVVQDDAADIIRLDYKNEAFSFYGIIPTYGKNLGDVLMHLDLKSWESIMHTISLYKKIDYKDHIDVLIPELNFGSDLNFLDVVQDMGVRKIFTSESELTEISKKPVSINKYVQSSVIKLDDQGVTLSSATDASVGPTAWIPGVSFYLDEPFYFFITENSTGAILFLGKVSQL